MYQFFTDDELVVQYRQAKDKRAQITVLADLCGISRAAMREYLRNLGCEIPVSHPKAKQGRKPFDRDLAEKLWQDGHTDPEIAEIVGASTTRIFQWRNENRLHANRGKRTQET